MFTLSAQILYCCFLISCSYYSSSLYLSLLHCWLSMLFFPINMQPRLYTVALFFFWLAASIFSGAMPPIIIGSWAKTQINALLRLSADNICLDRFPTSLPSG